MLRARTRLFHFAAIAAIVSLGCYGCNKTAKTPSTPGPSSSGETDTSGSQALTAEAAQELLPAAASMSGADFEKLATASSPSPETIENQTLTWVLLTLNPLKTSHENATVLEDFNFPTGNALPQPSQIAEVIYKSKATGYATFLQPDLITDCTCQSDGDTASGFVTFSAPDLYAGKVQFIARRNDDKWQIEEFHLTNYGIKTVLGNDGNWQQSPLETTDTSEKTTDTSDTEETDEPSNTSESDEASTASEPAAVAPITNGSNNLTNLIARHLVCKAASMSNKNFKKFAGPRSNLNADEYTNKSLTLTLLTHNLKKAMAENPEAANDFQFLGEIDLANFARALSRSETQGFASLIQPEFITHSACTTTGNTATGFVTFHAQELYSGKVDFVARRHAKGWQIEEFQLPKYGITLVLGKDGNWQHAVKASVPNKKATP